MAVISLFIVSFLAGFFVPLASEPYLLILQNEGMNELLLLTAATLGNSLGGMTCYWIARLGGRPLAEKYLRHSPEKLDRWERKLKGKGEWLALLCWAPLAGETIAAACGLLSLNSIRVALFMAIGKGLRYAILMGALQAFVQ